MANAETRFSSLRPHLNAKDVKGAGHRSLSA